MTFKYQFTIKGNSVEELERLQNKICKSNTFKSVIEGVQIGVIKEAGG